MWTKVIEDLNNAGRRDIWIAARLGVNQSTISRLRTGETVDPYYSIGKDLLDIHKVEMRKFKRKIL